MLLLVCKDTTIMDQIVFQDLVIGLVRHVHIDHPVTHVKLGTISSISNAYQLVLQAITVIRSLINAK
jgi:hypothetical protein